jgi:hypothetical protein
MTHKNGKVMTQEQLKMVAELTMQHDEQMERLWDLVLELRNVVADAGLKVPDAAMSKKAVSERAKHASIVKMQREKQRKFLDLD